jgi:hypothetical protein
MRTLTGKTMQASSLVFRRQGQIASGLAPVLVTV